MKSITWRLVMLIGFTLMGIYLFLPSTPISKSLPAFWSDNMPLITLGLDLQGGMHIVLEVDQDKAIETHVERLSDSANDFLKEKKIPFSYVRVRSGNVMSITYPSGSNKKVPQSIKEAISEEFPVFDSPSDNSNSLEFSLTETEVKRIRDWSTSQALETIRNRIDKFGVSEPVIQRQGVKEIVVQLPGLKDPDRAIDLIGKTAQLEFRLMADQSKLPTEVGGKKPLGTEILYQRRVSAESGEVSMLPHLVRKEVLLTGDLISDARVAFDRYNKSYVSLDFNRQGAKIFKRVTGENIGKQMAIVLDGNIYSYPTINEEIGGGKAQISGGFTSEQAVDLAIVLRAGALPAPVNIIQNVTVGPTLGQDSINAGIKAVMLGVILVVVFMIFFYKFSGVIAIVALTLNLIMLMGSMAYFNATLTLPGIAGILLTIGMGVDANVLIFERIKEELRHGRTPRSAVNAGYEHAWWTIVDSQVTTLITAAVLFQFGSGPIKGFAVTLSLGIVINLFTALVGTKTAFDIINTKSSLKKISI
ncbi:MAG: protein translocase subunit SecD [Thermodesulfobacteriota bacterium]